MTHRVSIRDEYLQFISTVEVESLYETIVFPVHTGKPVVAKWAVVDGEWVLLNGLRDPLPDLSAPVVKLYWE